MYLPTSLKSRIVLQIARKIASCNMTNLVDDDLWHFTLCRVNSEGVASFLAGEPVVDQFFSTIPGLIFDMCMISFGA